VRYLLSEAEKSFPDLVAETSRVVPIMRLTEVLRRLVEENVSIRNLRDILQAMLDWAPREKDGVLLTEQVRAALARQISHQATRGTRQLVAIGFESSLEDEIRAGIRPMPAGNFFVLDPERAEAIAGRVRSALGTDAGSGAVATVDSRVGGGTVVLVSMDIRRYVRSLLISHGIEASVLSYQDLSPEVRVEMRSRIRS
jgi:type III secretion protein V